MREDLPEILSGSSKVTLCFMTLLCFMDPLEWTSSLLDTSYDSELSTLQSSVLEAVDISATVFFTNQPSWLHVDSSKVLSSLDIEDSFCTIMCSCVP